MERGRKRSKGRKRGRDAQDETKNVENEQPLTKRRSTSRVADRTRSNTGKSQNASSSFKPSTSKTRTGTPAKPSTERTQADGSSQQLAIVLDENDGSTPDSAIILDENTITPPPRPTSTAYRRAKNFLEFKNAEDQEIVSIFLKSCETIQISFPYISSSQIPTQFQNLLLDSDLHLQFLI